MEPGAALYEQYLAGSDDALKALIDRYWDSLTLYLYTFVGTYAAAEDLAEDTFVKLAVKKPHFRGQAAFGTWLFAIGRNAALSALRRKRTEPLPDDANDELLIENTFLQQENKILVHRALRRLKPTYRQVLWLTYFADRSPKEIAFLLHKSVPAVDHLLARAKTALKKELPQEDMV